MDAKYWKVSEVAALAHVTVRTLHHYDEIGLLVPSRRSEAGYRLYSEADLKRLFQILMYRELGFALEAITGVLNAPGDERRAALRAHREALAEKQRRTDAVLRAVDRALESIERGKEMSNDEILEGFDAFAHAPEGVCAHQREHGNEARERWGETDAYRESMRRARGFSSADWEKIRAEAESTEVRMVALMRAGADPEGGEAMVGAEAMREHIARWFYPCSYRNHAALADMYEADSRFTAHYDDRADGFASFVVAAIRANAMRAWDAGEE